MKLGNLIKFNEHEREDGTLQLLMRKDQCMHCEEPGCLATDNQPGLSGFGLPI